MIAENSRAINFFIRIGTVTLFTLLCAFSTSLTFAQTAKISLTFTTDSKSVEARFQLSKAVDTLRFTGNGEIRLKTWIPLNGARLDDDGTALIFPKAQNWVSVKLNPFERDGLMDRVYSPVISYLVMGALRRFTQNICFPQKAAQSASLLLASYWDIQSRKGRRPGMQTT